MSKVILILIPLLLGCASTEKTQPTTIDEIIPDNQHFYDLLHIGNNLAYKSITKEDYEIEETCGSNHSWENFI